MDSRKLIELFDDKHRERIDDYRRGLLNHSKKPVSDKIHVAVLALIEVIAPYLKEDAEIEKIMKQLINRGY